MGGAVKAKKGNFRRERRSEASEGVASTCIEASEGSIVYERSFLVRDGDALALGRGVLLRTGRRKRKNEIVETSQGDEGGWTRTVRDVRGVSLEGLACVLHTRAIALLWERPKIGSRGSGEYGGALWRGECGWFLDMKQLYTGGAIKVYPAPLRDARAWGVGMLVGRGGTVLLRSGREVENESGVRGGDSGGMRSVMVWVVWVGDGSGGVDVKWDGWRGERSSKPMANPLENHASVIALRLHVLFELDLIRRHFSEVGEFCGIGHFCLSDGAEWGMSEARAAPAKDECGGSVGCGAARLLGDDCYQFCQDLGPEWGEGGGTWDKGVDGARFRGACAEAAGGGGTAVSVLTARESYRRVKTYKERKVYDVAREEYDNSISVAEVSSDGIIRYGSSRALLRSRCFGLSMAYGGVIEV
ncbi:hypothetical protein Tco_1214574 [Tanacetum coccineum]